MIECTTWDAVMVCEPISSLQPVNVELTFGLEGESEVVAHGWRATLAL